MNACEIFKMILILTVMVCPALVDLSNVNLNTTLAISGTVVEARCVTGYIFTSGSSITITTCLATIRGTWSFIISSCQRKWYKYEMRQND